jgi:hypothetical protein
MNKLRDLWKQFGSIDHPAIFALSGDAQTKEEIAQKSGFATTTVSDIMLEHQRTGLFTRHSDRMKHNRVSWALAGELAYYASIEDAVANTLKFHSVTPYATVDTCRQTDLSLTKSSPFWG